MKLSGAQIVLKCLKEQDVDVIFGYPGGAVIPLYDALYDEMDHFNHVRTSHEQGASHAADAYARVTGKVGVCIATSGPGATNTVTGIANAYMDSVPMVVITGQVANNLIGKDSFQEIDITGVTIPITKHNFLVKSIEKLADTLRRAFQIAKNGRPGPVLVDIPKDVFLSYAEYKKEDQIDKTDNEEKVAIQEEALKDIANEINKAQKPVIYAGGGIIISNASKELQNFSNKGDIPIVNTLMSLGSIDRKDRLSLGLVGMHGSKEANLSVNKSDLIIAIGARFSDRVIGNPDKFAPKSKIIHIDIDETEISKNIRADISLVGDVKIILNELINCIEDKNRQEWLDQIESWKHQKEINDDEFIPQNILNVACEVLGSESIVSTDVGQHQMWTAQHWNFKEPRTFITSGGLGTMGFGLGAAIGAQLGNPEKRVILVTGDGSFRMNCNELATVTKHNLPIIILLFNNSSLGMVRQWQNLFQDKKYSQTDLGDEVDYLKLAEAYRIEGYRVDTIKSLSDVLNKVSNNNRPVLVECLINKNSGVYPIVPPGKAINDLVIK
ncbi:acetolactate synthase large subunit [Gottschalkia purinilytica]|uniref:Acetolactate synthase n=1 Tax=Gottschalkia purinilytica TaxID=1503 RepID=A0A0L0WEW9_GOTPU|nr:biosynthetic-type acetolactate synthase large subunit [Gottschalkia purinilytica]KNF09976.1 acetolactate synthase large subunit [Gottschalkia purinilytica]